MNFRYIQTRISVTATTLFLLGSITFSSGCRNTAVGHLTAMPSKTGVNSDSVVNVHVFSMPVDSMHPAYQGVAKKSVRMFYSQRHDQLFWTSGMRCSDAADSVETFIENIRYYGLFPADYHFNEINSLRKELNSEKNVFRLEALLTDAYLTMYRHITWGKAMVGSDQTDSSGIALLNNPSYCGDIIKNITCAEPSFQGYVQLKQGLKQLLESLSTVQRNAALSDSAFVPSDLENQLQTISVNLERWRAERSSFGDKYIFINIPSFMLYLVENDSVILASKIIVGKPETPTPTLSGVIECFITYPYWHVPRKIAIEEYLPAIQSDSTFITRNNFDVLDRQGNVLNPDSLEWMLFHKNYFPVSLRQREGEDNALGVIKFIFDNPYAVYLHDTNARKLFWSKERAFSHGCIRMEKAVELAHYLVTGNLRKNSPYVDRFLREKMRNTIALRTPIPVHIRYYTCDFNNNKLHFYADIYRKDNTLADVIRPSLVDSSSHQ